LFAFDEGQSLSEHTAPFDAVAHVLEGEALITIAGVPLTVPAGDMVLMPANQPHAVAARKRFTMLLTMIRSSDALGSTQPIHVVLGSRYGCVGGIEIRAFLALWPVRLPGRQAQDK
jgi:mannose-6-phosphate isomerase-like protein (cupin superfamily)